MERLTKRNEADTAYYYPNCFRECDGLGYSHKCDKCGFQDKVCEKLGEYEDLEEQGLLLKLPCKVGDKLYVINSKDEILELTVKEFIYRAYRIPRLEIYFENGSGFETCLFDGTLNENVFLTKAEAEKELKKMESEE